MGRYSRKSGSSRQKTAIQQQKTVVVTEVYRGGAKYTFFADLFIIFSFLCMCIIELDQIIQALFGQHFSKLLKLPKLLKLKTMLASEK